jgi:hypothetical protein
LRQYGGVIVSAKICRDILCHQNLRADFFPAGSGDLPDIIDMFGLSLYYIQFHWSPRKLILQFIKIIDTGQNYYCRAGDIFAKIFMDQAGNC